MKVVSPPKRVLTVSNFGRDYRRLFNLSMLFMIYLSDDSQQFYKRQQVVEKKMKMHQQISVFLLQLTKCLSSCKKEIYTLPPQLIRPSLTTLKESVDNALYVAERTKGVSVKATSALQTMTQTATTIARKVYIPDSVHNSATRSHYHCLLRIRRFLNLALRVAGALHAFTEKFESDDFEQTKLDHELCGKTSDNDSRPVGVEVKVQDVQMVEPFDHDGCNSKKTSTDQNQIPSSDQQPWKLVVSIPLSKVSSSVVVTKNRSNSVLSGFQRPSPNLRASYYSCQTVLDDVVDVGVVVKRNKLSSRGSGHDPEMINDLLWKVRREVVEKQRAESASNLLHSVEKQSVFKMSCRKKRFSPYAGRPSSKKSSGCTNSEQVKCKPSKPGSDPQALKPEELKTALAPQPAELEQKAQPESSMDELADLFGINCKISESVCFTYANLSFKDPRDHELTSSVIPREQFPGIALQDGGVKFVLRESPLTPVLQHMKLDGKDLNVLPDNLLKTTSTADHQSSKGNLEQFVCSPVTCSPTPACAEPQKKVIERQTQLIHQSMPQVEEKVNPPAYWKPSLNVPFFLKPATLIYKSSFSPKPVVSILKKEQDQSPTNTQTESLQIMGQPVCLGCGFEETCVDSNNERPLSLVVSLPLSKIPSPPPELTECESCQQISAKDNGVVSENSISPQSVDYNDGIDEVSKNLSRCELVEKQSKWNENFSTVTTVKSQSMFKSSCKKRFSRSLSYTTQCSNTFALQGFYQT